jgi:chemotaxis protein methyltransferase CheR
MIALTLQEFQQLYDYIKKNFGINLAGKEHLVLGRLQKTLTDLGMESFAEYYRYLTHDPTGEAVTGLINKITTNHTFFLRENEHFLFLRDHVLPELSVSLKERDIRSWSAGCSSGEEPYTIAMILSDFFGPEASLWDKRILATDISERVLQTAADGVYLNEAIEKVPAHWRLQYFKPYDREHSIVADRIRKEVIYRRFNLMNEIFPFKKRFHIIFCRNVMIYFDQETKTNLVNHFYDCLESGGYLFIGHSESLNKQETKFRCLKPAVYRKE